MILIVFINRTVLSSLTALYRLYVPKGGVKCLYRNMLQRFDVLSDDHDSPCSPVVRLRKRNSCRSAPSQLLDRLQSVMDAAATHCYNGFLCPEVCPEVRSCHSAFARSSLDACTAENRIPSGGAGVPLSAWQHGTAPAIGEPTCV